MYEVFDHTADVGLRIRADTLDGLFAEAARALFSVIVLNLDAVRPVEEMSFALEGDTRDDLLHDWLAELLYVFHTKHLLFSRFEADIGDTKLRATARGEPIDPARHEIDTEIKAVTYHGLNVVHNDEAWSAEVIVDV